MIVNITYILSKADLSENPESPGTRGVPGCGQAGLIPAGAGN